MSLFGKFFESMPLGDLSYFRDGRLASYNFGQTNNYVELNAPRFKFLYFVRIDFNPEVQQFIQHYFKSYDSALLIPLIKSVEQPSVKVKNVTLNQYNKKRLSQQAIEFNPVKMTFYDVADGKTLRLWEMYYEYYFKNGVNSYKVDKTSKQYIKDKFDNDTVSNIFKSGQAGYNLENVKNVKQLFSSITIYQVHGGNYSKTMLINPIITDFIPSNMSYSDNMLCEHTITFSYEDVVYYNYIEPLQGDDWQVFNNSGFRELKPTKPRTPLNIENRAGSAVAMSETAVEDDTFLGKLGNALGDTGKMLMADILHVGTNLQRDLSGLVSGLPGMVASGVKQGILTGDFSLPINLSSALGNIWNQVERQTTGVGVRGLGVLTEGVVGAATGTVNNVFLDDNRVKNVSLEQNVKIQEEQAAKAAAGDK